jgi:hypothetical protein
MAFNAGSEIEEGGVFEPNRIISDKVATLEETIDSVNIGVASYGFVICLFPIMKDMKDHG